MIPPLRSRTDCRPSLERAAHDGPFLERFLLRGEQRLEWRPGAWHAGYRTGDVTTAQRAEAIDCSARRRPRRHRMVRRTGRDLSPSTPTPHARCGSSWKDSMTIVVDGVANTTSARLTGSTSRPMQPHSAVVGPDGAATSPAPTARLTAHERLRRHGFRPPSSRRRGSTASRSTSSRCEIAWATATLDRVTTPYVGIAARLAREAVPPTTGAPSPAPTKRCHRSPRDHDALLVVCPSAELSTTYGSAVLAARELGERPRPRPRLRTTAAPDKASSPSRRRAPRQSAPTSRACLRSRSRGRVARSRSGRRSRSSTSCGAPDACRPSPRSAPARCGLQPIVRYAGGSPAPVGVVRSATRGTDRVYRAWERTITATAGACSAVTFHSRPPEGRDSLAPADHRARADGRGGRRRGQRVARSRTPGRACSGSRGSGITNPMGCDPSHELRIRRRRRQPHRRHLGTGAVERRNEPRTRGSGSHSAVAWASIYVQGASGPHDVRALQARRSSTTSTASSSRSSRSRCSRCAVRNRVARCSCSRWRRSSSASSPFARPSRL